MQETSRYEGVWVKLPKDSRHVRKFFSKGKEYFQFGQNLHNGTVLNLSFFGVSEKQLGEHIVATVVVGEKKRGKRTFTTLHITHTPQAEVLGKIKFIPSDSGLQGCLTQDPSTLIYFELFR